MGLREIVKTGRDGLRYGLELNPPRLKESPDLPSRYLGHFMGLSVPPCFASVTYHAPSKPPVRKKGQVVYAKRFDRPATVPICHNLEAEFGVPVAPHIICVTIDKLDTQEALITAYLLGIQDVVALRGDAPEPYRFVKPEKYGNVYASDLVKQIADLREARYILGVTQEGETQVKELPDRGPIDLGIWVATYPEKHFESPNGRLDRTYLRLKQDRGADGAIAQMFFDFERFVRFFRSCRKEGINIPIVPGVAPLYESTQLTSLPPRFHCTMPYGLVKRMMSARTVKVERRIGISHTVRLCERLLEMEEVPMIQFFTYGSPDVVKEVIKALS